MNTLEMIEALRALEQPVVVDYGANKNGTGWRPVLVFNSYAPISNGLSDAGAPDRKNGRVTFMFGPEQFTKELALAAGKCLLGMPADIVEADPDWHP